jgi:hypothetical protein
VKVKVLKKFRDKYTGKIYKKVGTVIDVPKARFEEIRNTDASLVEAVEETAEDTSTEEKAEETATEEKAEETATEEKTEEKKPTKKAKTK